MVETFAALNVERCKLFRTSISVTSSSELSNSKAMVSFSLVETSISWVLKPTKLMTKVEEVSSLLILKVPF